MMVAKLSLCKLSVQDSGFGKQGARGIVWKSPKILQTIPRALKHPTAKTVFLMAPSGLRGLRCPNQCAETSVPGTTSPLASASELRPRKARDIQPMASLEIGQAPAPGKKTSRPTNQASKQANKASKQASKQANKQTNKQSSKQKQKQRQKKQHSGLMDLTGTSNEIEHQGPASTCSGPGHPPPPR